jgi:hypothetical protein
MVKSVNGIFGSMLLSAVALISPASVSADQIALTFEDNGFTVVGELEALTDVGYVVMTENGEFTIPFGFVTCDGDACPVMEQTVLAEG